MSYDGTDQIPGPGEQPSATGPAAPGLTGQPATAPRLVRDPYSRLGGVASGLAHYFGLDVSIVRIGFVLATFFSGFGIVVYLLAWLVVPRAEFWPPSGTSRPIRSITGRETGIGLAVVGALLFLFFSGGGAAQVLVPALLITGGVWLLRQPDADQALGSFPSSPSAGAMAAPTHLPPPDERTRVFESTEPTEAFGATASTGPDVPFSSPSAPQPADTVANPYADGHFPPPPGAGGIPGGVPGVQQGAPVPPRRRRWRRVIIPLLILFVFLPLLLIALVVGLVLGNGINIDAGFDSVYRPRTIEEIPSQIDQDAGELVLDLTALDLDDFVPTAPDAPAQPDAPGPIGATTIPEPPEIPELPDLPDLPIPIAIDMGFGEVRVIVPDGLEISVDAQSGVGDVNVFGRSDDGFDNGVEVDADDPVIELEIDLGVGEVRVERD